MNVTNLTCEYITDPLGVDCPAPRFSWIVHPSERGQMQEAYEILVASSREALQSDDGNKWRTGRVASGASVNIVYEGAPPAGGEICYWKVRAYADGQAGPWSAIATFEMSLLDEDAWAGGWIGADADVSAPLLRKDFALDKPVTRARLYVAGIGWSETYLNGRKVSDRVLDPATSEYGRSVIYVAHDVTDMLVAADNAIGVMLGNGWYCEPGNQHYGDSPRLRLQLNVEYEDGTTAGIVSDASWRTSSGPISQNDFYNGEIYDARNEKPGWAAAGYDDADWAPALAKDAPGGRMACQLMPPIRVNERIKPLALTCPQDDTYVYHFPKLFGGWVRLKVKAPAGTKITIRYSALLDEETGRLDRHRHPEESKATDVYICKGDPAGESYEPRFTYHPVRYVQIEGCPRPPTIHDVEGCAVYTDEDMSGDFQCSDRLWNTIHENVVQTLKNGLFGMPLDCLYREHWAWTDPATITGSLYPRKHMPAFWTKWLTDIADSQGDDGAIPQICPAYLGRGFDAAWGGNYPLLVWYLHQYYGDDRILDAHYEGMKRCVDHMTGVAESHLIKTGRYGDHMMPGGKPGEEEFVSSETPKELVWTGYYYRAALVLARIAEKLGRGDDAKAYDALAATVAEAINAEWLNAETGVYADGAQTANIFPVALGIVPEDKRRGVIDCVVRGIVEQYNHHHHTGNTGTTCLIDMLTKLGHGDVWSKVMRQTTYPGWGFMVENGATTIWESWSLDAGCGNSESMIMWATIDEFFYNDVAGIKGPDYYEPTVTTPGYAEIRIAPFIPEHVHFVGATVRTVRGNVVVNWRREGTQQIRMDVTIPGNATADVSVPTLGNEQVVVRESDHVVWDTAGFTPGPAGIADGKADDGAITLRVGPGEYRFHLTAPEDK